MRLLHTADWHLGKTLKGVSLLDDQKFIIDQIFDDIIDKQQIDAVIIAGDIYDRAVPPIDAVDLFNDTLNRFAEKNLPTLIISGNHDSATRLNFGSKLFADKKIFIASKDDEPLIVPLNDGEIYFALIPFAEPDALAEMITSAREQIPAGKRSVAVAHAFLTGGVESESERKFVGGSANVDAQIFNGFDYVALGHLHRPQKISAENIRYAGSPLKYSFDEATHQKSVTIVELNEQGFVNAEKFLLKPLHDVRVVKGTLAELKKNFNSTEDYIHAQLTEREINVQDKLAYVFPNLLSVEFILEKNFKSDNKTSTVQSKGSTLDYFAEFFEKQTGESLSDDYRAAMSEILSNLAGNEREA